MSIKGSTGKTSVSMKTLRLFSSQKALVFQCKFSGLMSNCPREPSLSLALPQATRPYNYWSTFLSRKSSLLSSIRIDSRLSKNESISTQRLSSKPDQIWSIWTTLRVILTERSVPRMLSQQSSILPVVDQEWSKIISLFKMRLI